MGIESQNRIHHRIVGSVIEPQNHRMLWNRRDFQISSQIIGGDLCETSSADFFLNDTWNLSPIPWVTFRFCTKLLFNYKTTKPFCLEGHTGGLQYNLLTKAESTLNSDQIAQDLFQSGFEYHQGQIPHNLPGHSITMLNYPHSDFFFQQPVASFLL